MSINLKRALTTAALVAVVALLAQPALAQDSKFAIRFGIVGFSPTSDTTIPGTTTTVGLDDAGGLEFDFEWYFARRWGLEASIATGVDADTDIDDSSGSDVFTSSGVAITPLTVGINWHAARSEAVDWYIGLVAGQVYYGDFDFTSSDGTSMSNVRTSDEVTYGIQSAVDLSVNDSGSWAINIGLKYLVAEFDASILDGMTTRVEKIDVNPLMLRVMGVFHF